MRIADAGLRPIGEARLGDIVLIEGGSEARVHGASARCGLARDAKVGLKRSHKRIIGLTSLSLPLRLKRAQRVARSQRAARRGISIDVLRSLIERKLIAGRILERRIRGLISSSAIQPEKIAECIRPLLARRKIGRERSERIGEIAR